MYGSIHGATEYIQEILQEICFQQRVRSQEQPVYEFSRPGPFQAVPDPGAVPLTGRGKALSFGIVGK